MVRDISNLEDVRRNGAGRELPFICSITNLIVMAHLCARLFVKLKQRTTKKKRYNPCPNELCVLEEEIYNKLKNCKYSIINYSKCCKRMGKWENKPD